MITRISPARISSLKENEVFVFGSNIYGMHGGGAARYAYEHFGAEWGVGEGLTGRCYALPTMEGAENFRQAVVRFTACARENPALRFLVTPVGCGIAGYAPEMVAPWFEEASELENVCLPEEFWAVIHP